MDRDRGVTGVDGFESFVNGEGRFVRGPVTGLVEAAGEIVPVFVMPRSAVFVMAVGHIEINDALFSEGALDLLCRSKRWSWRLDLLTRGRVVEVLTWELDAPYDSLLSVLRRCSERC